ncbi:MAG TPA: MFS transporter [Steroidobacteraceae bacterium]|nr:MFS transporter [Steroidobacteraceae bacterium]
MTADRSWVATRPAALITAWAPFQHRVFTVVWIATVVSNIGGWMYTAAAGWLMTTLTPNPLMVSLVQVANSLPVLIFAFPAGALADGVDKRKFLLLGETSIAVVSTLFAFLVWRRWVGPDSLLFFLFMIGAGGALTAAPWQAVVPDLVPKEHLAPAVALNSLGVNVSRAVGSALGGLMIAVLGISSPFWANGVSNAGVIGALLWWRSPPRPAVRLPAEPLMSAMRTGFRHARHNPRLRATLIRATAFFSCASAYWALLPLVARERIAGGPQLYGILLGVIGVGAILGALVLRRLRARLGNDHTVLLGSVGTALAISLFGIARDPYTALVASFVAGVCWVGVLATLNLSAQTALPDWVRGRGLAIYIMVFFGAMSVGSVLWGQLASWTGLLAAHLIAAAATVAGAVMTARWKVQHSTALDLTPSGHWPMPQPLSLQDASDGPVLVTVRYQVTAERRNEFLTAMEHLSHGRRRDGAYAWAIYEDLEHPGSMLETFTLDSWTEHLRQHERVTRADRDLQERIRKLTQHEPVVTHLISATKH